MSPKPQNTSKCWLVFTKSGVDRLVKQKMPTLKAHERCIELHVTIPVNLFDPAPPVAVNLFLPDTGPKVTKITLLLEDEG